jgi:hypothetical protein
MPRVEAITQLERITVMRLHEVILADRPNLKRET